MRSSKERLQRAHWIRSSHLVFIKTAFGADCGHCCPLPAASVVFTMHGTCTTEHISRSCAIFITVMRASFARSPIRGFAHSLFLFVSLFLAQHVRTTSFFYQTNKMSNGDGRAHKISPARNLKREHTTAKEEKKNYVEKQ